MLHTIKTAEREELLISYYNEEEFERTYLDIFERNEYPFKSNKTPPFILDCGSHIGLSILYFKKLYPNSKIIAFEPNPKTLPILKLNLKQNKITDVKVVNAAVANNNGYRDFYLEYKDKTQPSWGGSLAINKWFDVAQGEVIKVKTIKLSTFITRPVDLIKLDIEGTEEEVVREIEPKMNSVQKIFIEFHGSSTNPTNNELRIIDILKGNSFNVKINQDWQFISEDQIKHPDPYWLSIYGENKF